MSKLITAGVLALFTIINLFFCKNSNVGIDATLIFVGFAVMIYSIITFHHCYEKYVFTTRYVATDRGVKLKNVCKVVQTDKIILHRLFSNILLLMVGAFTFFSSVFAFCDESSHYSHEKTIEGCNKYLTEGNPFKKYAKEEIATLDSLISKASIDDLIAFLKNREYPDTKKCRQKAKMIVDVYFKKELAKYEKENTIGKWIIYRDSLLKIYPYSGFTAKDATKRIKHLMEHGFEKEPSAWANALSVNEKWAYDEYLNHFPNGLHAKQAIDSLVSTIAKGEHGKLPQMQRTRAYGGKYTTVEIENETEYELRLMYSGVESKRVVLKPKQKQVIKFYSGKYSVAASVVADGINDYAGTEDLQGGDYYVSFYISRSPIGRTSFKPGDLDLPKFDDIIK